MGRATVNQAKTIKKKRARLRHAPPPSVAPGLIAPPDSLSDDVKRVWVSVVSAHPADYFSAAHVPMLRSYCYAAARAGDLQTRLDKMQYGDEELGPMLDTLDKLERRMLASARSLRITPQSQRPPPLNVNDRGHGPRAAVTNDQGEFDWRSHFPAQGDEPLPN